jgi:hypothetical protein
VYHALFAIEQDRSKTEQLSGLLKISKTAYALFAKLMSGLMERSRISLQDET